MSEQQYSIVMQTPIGKKYGSLSVSILADRLNGYLTLLNHNEPIEGTIDGSGNCSFTGKLVTLLRTIPYVATGIISDSEVKLQIKGARNTFRLTGVIDEKGKD
ncbi:MAG: hypothetical protein ACI4D0_00130 [Lachnospira sp.]